MSEDMANGQTLGEVSRQIIKLEANVEHGFSSMNRQLESFDSKYARNDAVMALHAKTSDIIKDLAAHKVEHERDIGESRGEILSLKSIIKTWTVVGGAIMGIVFSVATFLIQRGLS